MERLSERAYKRRSHPKEIRSDRKSVGTHRIAGKKYIYHQTGVYLPRGLYVYWNIREYAVQANIRQGDSALQATWQNDIFRQRRSG